MRHEISTSWYTTSQITPATSPRRLAVVLEDGGATGVLVHGVSGEVAHITVKSGPAELRGRSEEALDARDMHRSSSTAQSAISILAAALMAAAMTHGLWLAAVD